MELPIDLIKSSPPLFKWKQAMHSLGGSRVVEHTGQLPPAVEGAVISLIKLAKAQEREIENLKKQLVESVTTFTKPPPAPATVKRK